MLLASEAFSRRKRLVTSREFARVFARATRSADRFFTVLGRPNNSQIPRLGLAISRRAAGKAVQRNRLKRYARETFRVQSTTLPPWDFVVLAKPAAAGADAGVLRRSLERHFLRLSAKAAASRHDG